MSAGAYRALFTASAPTLLVARRDRGCRRHARAVGVLRTFATMGKGEADADPPTTRSGRCFCGKVCVTLTGAPTAVSICHCVNCRKLSGAPFTAQALVKGTQVEVRRDEGVDELVGFASSQAVERFRCPECLSPVYASLNKGKMAAVPLSILNGGDADADCGGGDGDVVEPPLKATHHMYYADRIIDVPDDLPKYVKSAGRQAELWTDAVDCEGN